MDKFNLTDYIIRWEEGGLRFEEEIRLFQHLLDTGMIAKLQGFYGRHAQMLLDEGFLTMASPPNEDDKPIKAASRRGRPTTKRKGAMVAMAQRRIKGSGIIIDRVENLRKLTGKELRYWANKMKQEYLSVPLNEYIDSHLEDFGNHNNYVLIHWFEKPSDYNMDRSHYQRGWYPDKWVKVISPAPSPAKEN